MLNPFPIQFLALFAYFLLRLFVGGILLYSGYVHFKASEEIAKSLRKLPPVRFLPARGAKAGGTFSAWLFIALEALSGILFVVGFYTQVAALAVMGMSVTILIFHKRLKSAHFESRTLYALLFAASLSLFVTGAGVFAFDLPI